MRSALVRELLEIDERRVVRAGAGQAHFAGRIGAVHADKDGAEHPAERMPRRAARRQDEHVARGAAFDAGRIAEPHLDMPPQGGRQALAGLEIGCERDHRMVLQVRTDARPVRLHRDPELLEVIRGPIPARIKTPGVCIAPALDDHLARGEGPLARGGADHDAGRLEAVEADRADLGLGQNAQVLPRPHLAGEIGSGRRDAFALDIVDRHREEAVAGRPVVVADVAVALRPLGRAPPLR